MRKGTFYNIIPLALALIALALVGEVQAVPPPLTPLLKTSVDGGTNTTPKFVSFLPTNKNDLVWTDFSRRTAWSQRVAEKMGYGADNVILQPFSEPFHITAKELKLQCLLQVGMKGSETLSVDLDSVGKISTTHQFEVVSVSESEVAVVWNRVSQSPFRLRCEQGAGGDIWFVTSDELEARWTQKLKDGDGAGVRREVNLVLGSLDWESTSIGRGDREGWREWLFEFKEKTPATWPSIVFKNAYTNAQGKTGPVEVTCGGETSPKIQPGGTWTNTWEKWDPKLKPPVSWTFRAPDDNLLDDDFGEQEIGNWSPKKDVPEVRDVSAQPPLRPFLVIGSDVISVPDIWAALAPSGDENQICDMQVKVVYGNGASSTFSGARNAIRRLLPYQDGGEWKWKVELLPNTEITEVIISSSTYFSESTFHLDEKRYKCGEAARVRRGGKLNLRPWPTITLRNDAPRNIAPRTVNYQLFLGQAEGVPIAQAKAVAEEAEFDLSKVSAMKDMPATNVTLRIVGRAPGAIDGYIDIGVLRGGRAVDVGLSITNKPLEWVELEDRTNLIDGVWPQLMRDYPFDNIRTTEAYLNMCKAQIFTDPTFLKILRHYYECENPTCPQCGDFHAKVEQKAKSIGAQPMEKSWNDMVPKDLQNANGRGTEMVAVLLVLCDEFCESRDVEEFYIKMKKNQELTWEEKDRQKKYDNIKEHLCGKWPLP